MPSFKNTPTTESEATIKSGSVPRVPEGVIAQLPDSSLRWTLEGRRSQASTAARDALHAKFSKRLVFSPNFKTLTTSNPDKGKPILGWFFYKEAFSAALVQQLVNDATLNSDANVLDPFGGIGTVPFACQALGVNATGVDMSPLPVFIANTKLRAANGDFGVDLLTLSEMVEQSMAKASTDKTHPDVSIWAKAFDADVAHSLLAALECIESHRSKRAFTDTVCDLAHLALLCVAENVSHTVKDGTSLRLREPGRRLGRAGVTKTADDLSKQFRMQSQSMAADMQIYQSDLLNSGTGYKISNICIQGDARRLEDHIPPNSVDLVITSPPYPNRYDYSSIYALELLLGFVQNRDQLRALRFDLFRSHLEAPWPTNIKNINQAVEEILTCFYSNGMSSPRVFKMILGYFADIEATLSQLYTVMKKGAVAHFVVGNVRIEGQEVPVDIILSEIAESIGFDVLKISVARYKGTNSQQAKRFGAGKLRESIISFIKN